MKFLPILLCLTVRNLRRVCADDVSVISGHLRTSSATHPIVSSLSGRSAVAFLFFVCVYFLHCLPESSQVMLVAFRMPRWWLVVRTEFRSACVLFYEL
jgi:hypothetical protein